MYILICKTWGKNLAGKIEIRLDSPEGELVGTCEMEPMEGEVAYAIHETEVKPVTGKHALVLIFSKPPVKYVLQNKKNSPDLSRFVPVASESGRIM